MKFHASLRLSAFLHSIFEFHSSFVIRHLPFQSFTFASVSLSARADCCNGIISFGHSLISTGFDTTKTWASLRKPADLVLSSYS